ncbi:MAG: TDP-N-acetylfucosamine:lipid II N-acetylfucosaminyltransferase [Pseudomonadota bacterium]
MPAIFSRNFFSPIPNLRMVKQLFQAEKIIIHSLASPFLLLYLYVFPSLRRKCYWAIWGKDLYFYKTLSNPRIHHNIYEFFRKKVIRDLPNVIGFSKRDIAYAKQWYQNEGLIHHSFSYPSNCYKELPLKSKTDPKAVNILFGNSADPTNDHFSVFSMIENHLSEINEITIPLSYGDPKYAVKVKKEALDTFGNQAKVLEDLLALDDYLNLISEIDIAVFPHTRQQAMGTIITLLGIRKKVYIRRDVTTWGTLKDLGIVVYDIENFDTGMPSLETLQNNEKIIKETFSENALLEQWSQIFTH